MVQVYFSFQPVSFWFEPSPGSFSAFLAREMRNNYFIGPVFQPVNFDFF